MYIKVRICNLQVKVNLIQGNMLTADSLISFVQTCTLLVQPRAHKYISFANTLHYIIYRYNICDANILYNKTLYCVFASFNLYILTGDSLWHDVCHLTAGGNHPHTQFVHHQHLKHNPRKLLSIWYLDWFILDFIHLQGQHYSVMIEVVGITWWLPSIFLFLLTSWWHCS